MFSSTFIRHTFRALCVFLFLAFSTACSVKTNIPIGTVPMANAPESNEIVRTRAYIEQNFSSEGLTLSEDKKAIARIKGIVDRLSKAAGAESFTYPVYLVEAGEDVNAFAVNSTSIVVYRALLEKTNSDDELATVLGHEVAHIVSKHSNDDTTEDRSTAVSVGSALLGGVAAIAAAYSGAGSATIDLVGDLTSTATNAIGHGAFVRSYDRKLEYEADHVGLMIMAKAGYDPEVAIDFWRRAEEIFGGSNSISFFSTHPSNDDRMENLMEALPLAKEYYQEATNSSSTSAKKEAKKKTSEKSSS